VVDLGDVQELLPFEDDGNEDADVDVDTWKERGDALLRLGDVSSAASYYERGLYESSSVSIGSTVVVSVKGFPKLAEVDCMEDDGNVDVTLVESGEEVTVKNSSILLAVKESDPEQLQERILLNLARCMLQLSDLDTSTDRSKYLKAAILATSLVVTMSCSQADEVELPTNAQTALVLRAKAQMGLSRWPQARQDATKLVKAGNEQGSKLLASVERKKQILAKADKRLAKEMCKLVQSTTCDASVSPRPEEEETNPPNALNHASLNNFLPSPLCGIFLFLLLPLVAASVMAQLYPEQLKQQK
jgi:hypothetical protein